MRNSLVQILPLLLSVAQPACAGLIVSSEVWDGRTYHLIAKDTSLTAQTWAEAEAFATSLGGNLASINSAAENAFLFNRFGDTDPDDFGVWIGLTDTVSEGDFAWSSGDSLAYENWWPGQPDNSRDQDFAYMIDPDNPFFLGASGQWDDGISPRPFAIAEVAAIPEPNGLILTIVATGVFCLHRRRSRHGAG